MAGRDPAGGLGRLRGRGSACALLDDVIAALRAGDSRTLTTDLLTADPASVNQTIRGRAITFVPQDPFTSFNPVFTVGDQIMEILKWKSPRATTPNGRGWLPAVVSRYPADRRRQDFDAVLLDLTMPVMTGEETYRLIKEIDPAVPVIVSSGYDEVEAARRFGGEGLADFIQKPYVAHTLADKIKTAIRHQSAE